MIANLIIHPLLQSYEVGIVEYFYSLGYSIQKIEKLADTPKTIGLVLSRESKSFENLPPGATLEELTKSLEAMNENQAEDFAQLGRDATGIYYKFFVHGMTGILMHSKKNDYFHIGSNIVYPDEPAAIQAKEKKKKEEKIKALEESSKKIEEIDATEGAVEDLIAKFSCGIGAKKAK